MAIFKQGQLNQVLAVCVDKTDFATIESGVSSSFTCTFYGIKQASSAAASAVTLSRAPSVVHSGIIRVTAKSTETSGVDNGILKIAHASCADQYIPITFQIQDLSGAISDLDSAMTSQFSDLQSRIPKEIASKSLLSDVQSNLLSYLAGISDTLSAIYVDTADISNILSNTHADLADLSAIVSDFYSDFQSRVPKAVATASRLLLAESVISDAHSAAEQANSRALVIQSMVSEVDSQLNVTDSAIDSLYSDLASKIGNVSVTLSESDISDIASAVIAGGVPTASAIAATVWSDYGSKVGATASAAYAYLSNTVSGILADTTDISDILSNTHADLADLSAIVSDFYSVFQSRVPKAVATASRLLLAESVISDAHSAAAQANSRALVVQSLVSDIDSQLLLNASMISDTQSQLDVSASVLDDIENRVSALESVASDAHSAAAQANSRALVIQSMVSDVDSQLTVTDTALDSQYSDLASKISGITVSLDVSDISNIASAVWADAIGSDINSKIGKLTSRITKEVASTSLLSDVQSNLLSYLAGISDVLSAVYVDTTDISNVLSNTHADLADLSAIVSDFYSDFQSRVPKAVATASRLLLAESVISDAHSAAAQANSRALVLQSMISDVDSQLTITDTAIDSLFSDLASKTGNVSLSESDMSDLRSAIAGVSATVSASSISDIASAVWANAIGSDVNSKIGKLISRITKTVATNSQLSDLHSDLKSYMAGISSQDSDIYSLLSDLDSNLQSRIPKEIASKSLLSDVSSDLRSLVTTTGVILTAAGAQAAADEFLNRNLAGGGSGNTRNVRNALRPIRNKVTTDGTNSVINVYEEDDTTVAWSGAISTASGNPIVDVDPT